MERGVISVRLLLNSSIYYRNDKVFYKFHSQCWQKQPINFPPLLIRIQFSSPSVFLGGPGMLSRTSRASWDLLTMTSLSLTAVCIRLTLEWSLKEKKELFNIQFYELLCWDLREKYPLLYEYHVSAHGLMLSMSLKPSGVEQPECVALYCMVFSLVQVIWTRRWCSELPPALPALSRSPPSVSSSSSDPILVRRSMELRSFTSWA